MPQLKKVVVAMGNALIYRDTYEQAISELLGGNAKETSLTPTTSEAVITDGLQPKSASGAAVPSSERDSTVQAIRERLRKYRDLSSQGRWAEAGRELEAVEKLVGR